MPCNESSILYYSTINLVSLLIYTLSISISSKANEQPINRDFYKHWKRKNPAGA